MTDPLGLLWNGAGSAVALLAMTLGPLVAGVYIVGRFQPEAPVPVRWVAIGVASASVVLGAFLVLTALHAFVPFAATGICLLVAGAAALAWRRQGPAGRDLQALVAGFRWCRRTGLLLPFTLSAFAVLVAAVRALQMPPLAWDSLTYHLVLAGKWVQTGARTPFSAPDGMDGYSHFPFNGEAFAAWLMLPTHGDDVVNLLNFPFLVLLALTTYALARELGGGRAISSLVAACVMLSPMLFSYVTTAYVDVQVCAELLAAALFFFRFERTGRGADAVFLFAALGLAMGTKPTAAWMTILFGVFSVLLAVRRRTGFGALALGITLLVALGGTKYVENFVASRNPVYPIGVSVAGREIFPGSKYVERAAAVKGAGTWRQDLENLATMFGNEPASYPRTAGPLFLVFVGAAASSLVWAPPSLSRRRRVLLPFFWLVPLVAFYLDRSANSTAARRFWPTDTPRFLAAPLAVAAVIATLQLARFPRERRLVTIALAAAAVISLAPVNLAVLAPVPGVPVALALLALTMLPVWAWIRARGRPARRAVLVLATVAAYAVALPALASLRAGLRWKAYTSYIDLHDILRLGVGGWRWCDEPGRPHRIAFTTGWAYSGHNWYFYPLLGTRLQNDVVYASINRVGDAPTDVDRGLLRETADFEVWRRNLADKRVELVFVQNPEPVEAFWMKARPELFEPVNSGPGYAIFRVRGGRP